MGEIANIRGIEEEEILRSARSVQGCGLNVLITDAPFRLDDEGVLV